MATLSAPGGVTGLQPRQPDQAAGAPAGPAPLPPLPPILAGDPAYMAYQRALGLEDTVEAAEGQYRMDAIKQQLGQRMTRTNEAYGEQREQISYGHEDRGLHRSGAHELAQARSRRDQGYAVGDLQQGAGDQISDLLYRIAKARAGRQVGGVEQAMQSAVSLFSLYNNL